MRISSGNNGGVIVSGLRGAKLLLLREQGIMLDGSICIFFLLI